MQLAHPSFEHMAGVFGLSHPLLSQWRIIRTVRLTNSTVVHMIYPLPMANHEHSLFLLLAGHVFSAYRKGWGS